MADDIVDAAQKKINSAAQSTIGGNPLQSNNDLLKEPSANEQSSQQKSSITAVQPSTTTQTNPTSRSKSDLPSDVTSDTETVSSIMESVLSTDVNKSENPPSEISSDNTSEQRKNIEASKTIDDTKQKQNKPPTDNVSSLSVDDTHTDLTPTVLPPPKQPKHGKSGPIIAIVLLFLLTIPLGVFFISQQRQIAEIRSKATGPYPSGNNCSRNTDCLSGYCDGPSGVCKPQNPAYKLPNGENCVKGDNCTSGYCDGPRGVCWPNPNATTTAPRTTPAIPTSTAGTTPSGGPTPTPDYENFDYITFSCDTCGSDRRCQTEIGTNPQFSTGANPGSCNQIDKRAKGSNGDWEAVSLCDSSCSGGGSQEQKDEEKDEDKDDKDKDKDKDGGLECKKIKIYKDGQEVDNPSTLMPGDQIVASVKGDNAKKAHIRLNGAAWVETDTKNDKGEFIKSFTIPNDATKITLEAEVSKDGKKWE
ncbi:hypothetical protein HY409_02160 [Candidatus Gottesmanbacteria bacterium]|nr:hypothetical protein [Candidatus Gottesmanbacteria bacterium]